MSFDTPVGRPFACAVDAATGLAYARLWGEVTGADMLEAVQAVHGDPAWEDGFDAIWDCSSVTVHVVSPDEVKPLIDEEAASEPGHDVLIESPVLGESALSEMLPAFCRCRGKTMTVHSTLQDALAELAHEALPPASDAVG